LIYDPPSEEIIEEAAGLVLSACRKAFGDNLVCITLKGSAVKGDFIAGYSDFDFHIFLKPEVMDDARVPKAECAIEFQRAFGSVNPQDFHVSQFQIYFIDSEAYPEDWLPPVEGTYMVFYGCVPAAAGEAEEHEYLRLSLDYLASVEESRKTIVGRFVDKPNGAIPSLVRLSGTTLKGYMYSVSALALPDPKQGFRLGLDEMIEIVEREVKSGGHIGGFFQLVSDWGKIQADIESARQAFKEGDEAMKEIDHWYENRKREEA
jgi:predicted nucleotidyltransferase